MTEFCAHIDRLFTELPFAERCRAARRSGFSSVEFILPKDVSLGELGDAVAYDGLKPCLMEMPEAEAASAFWKKTKKDFGASMDRMLEVADFIGCRLLYVPGRVLPEEDFEDSREAFTAALHRAAQDARRAGVKILLGFRNAVETPGFYPASTLEVLQILDELNDDRAFGCLYDVYQAQTVEGGLSNTLESLSEIIAHIRIAGVPSGEEPDIGEIDYGYLFALLEARGYAGQIGCAYTPRRTTAEGLKWMQKYL